MINQPAPGKAPDVMIDPAPTAPVSELVRLCNFPTGQATLLQSHRDQLASLIGKAAFEGTAGHIDCVGISSKLGFQDSSKSNQKLSEQRAAAVRDFIQSMKVVHDFKINVSMGVGDRPAQLDPTGNDGFFRAVEVKFFVTGKFNPFPKPQPAPPPKPFEPKPSRNFQFQCIQLSSASFGLKVSGAQTDVMEFAIRDMINGRTRYFLFLAGEASMPTPEKLDGILKKVLSLPIGVSVGRISNKVSFILNEPITDLETFAGSATIAQAAGASLGNQSIGGDVSFTFSATLPSGKSQSVVAKFSTSKGLATPSLGSGGVGIIVALKPSHKPRTFPGEEIL